MAGPTETEQDTPQPEARILDPEFERRRVAYHEAAHAVVGWDLGFGVMEIVVDRERFSGRVQPYRRPKDRSERVAYAANLAAGLAAHSFVEPTMTWPDVSRCVSDLSRAAALFVVNNALTDGEQLGVGITLVRKVVPLLHEPEVKKQIESLTKPLLRDGKMFQAQIHERLARHPASAAARRRCREFARDLEKQHDEIVARSAGYAPEFRWPANRPDER